MSELTTRETQSFLERATRDPTIDVAKLEQLIALQERVADREAKRQFAEAMNALQEKMPQVTKDRLNPHTRSRYATYEEIDAIIRPYYTRHGFSVSFRTWSNQGRIRVQCVVKHVGGHEEASHELESGPDTAGSRGQANKTEVQGVGSIVTYLKRYTLQAAFAVAVKDDETDDDGNGTMRAEAQKVLAQKPPPPSGKPTVKEWLDRYQMECANAQTQDEATALLDRDEVVNSSVRFAPWPTVIETIERTNQQMIARLWGEVPSIAGEEKAAG